MRSVPDAPSYAGELFSVGVTGTNGKTTTTTLVSALLGTLARPVATVTTLGFSLDDEPLDVPPHYEGFIATMQRAIERGGRYAAIEYTSEALALGAARGWPCRIGVFLNLSHDHGEAHASVEHYLASKAQLFVMLHPEGTAVLNGCDEAAALIAQVTPPSAARIHFGLLADDGAGDPADGRSAGVRGPAWTALDLSARATGVDWSGTELTIEASPRLGLPRARVATIRAIGEAFAEDALAALAAALVAGVPLEVALDTLALVAPPVGRFERVAEGPDVVVDYAHSPDALARTLRTARALCRGHLVVVVGAGGDRDRAKRPLLGAAASQADRVILTSDNPRSEDPRAIARAIRDGVASHVAVDEELDRARAITRAVAEAARDDLVVIAGKGHETDQVLAGGRRHFSDHEAARTAARSRGI